MDSPNTRILASTPLFSGVSSEGLEELGRFCQAKNFRKGDILFHCGDRADGFYVVVEGELEVFRTRDHLREQTLHLVQEGEVCGEVPIFSGGTYPAGARARTPLKTLYVPGDAFLDLAHRHPEMLLEMLAVLSKRLRRFTDVIAALSLKDVQARLAEYLLDLVQKASDETVELPTNRKQLAARLGTIPETLSRVFGKLAEAGMLSVSGRKIEILAVDELRALAEG